MIIIIVGRKKEVAVLQIYPKILLILGIKSFDYNTVNTLVKMCQKRALVGAVLIVCGVSQYFTQDLDDDR